MATVAILGLWGMVAYVVIVLAKDTFESSQRQRRREAARRPRR